MTSAAIGTIGLGDEHLELHAAARRWCEGHVDPVATKAALDEADEARPAFWADLRGLGWLGLAVSERHGGEGYGLLELGCVLEELGRAAAPGPFLPTVVASAIVDRLGDDELRAEVLADLATGERTAGVGLGAAPLEAAADGAGLVLSGETRPVLGGGLAELLLVPARTDGADGTEDLWCLLDAESVKVVTLASLDGTRRLAAVTVDGLHVPAHRVLRGPTVGAAIGAVAVALASAEAVGSMGWCVDVAAEHARTRVQFGRPIGQFQAVKHRCAEMLCSLELARSAAWDALRALDVAAGEPAGAGSTEAELAAAVAGAVVPDAAFAVAKDCVQVLGGIGYTWEHDAHLHLRRATAVRQLLGGPHPWRAEVARHATAGTRRTLAVELPPEADPIRAEVRAFVADTQARPKSEWNRALADGGYLVPYWPAPWGRDASPLEQLVIDEELAAARLRRPHLQVGAWVLPTIIVHGTPEQQERFLPPTLRGEVLWCQLFSEPGAGSDLASLATRAERDDGRGGWRITGQKVWTTMAHVAQWGLLLARTDPLAPKHEGITAFVVDMTSPGIDIRPLRELTGAALFNEVFFDEVFVPDDCVIGAVHDGWEAARTTLANERVSMGSGSSFGPGVESVLALVASRGHTGDPLVADEVGDLVARGQALAVMGLRTTLRALAGAAPGAEASVRKLLATEHEQRTQEVGLALLGADGAADDGEAALWLAGFLGNRALSIAGGTSDIQRNIVAERLLDLPKDPAPGE